MDDSVGQVLERTTLMRTEELVKTTIKPSITTGKAEIESLILPQKHDLVIRVVSNT